MTVYRVLFISNEVSDIHSSARPPRFEGDYTYYAHNGRLVYAYVRAGSREGAAILCREIIRKVKQPVPQQPGLPD